MLNIPGYEIRERIGQGATATVYLAIQQSLERPVALKVLDRRTAPGFSERFLREGRTIAALVHPHIATIYDIGIADGCHYLSMEYLTGGDLKRRIEQQVSRGFALTVVSKVASALAAAHSQSIVHRDVKPANILFRDANTPVLTDFGIAKQSVSAADLTATGELLGTPHYLSPEQAQTRPLDGRADIYSLGIVLYEMLVGDKPYHGDSDINIVFQQVYEPLPRLPAAHADLQALVDAMTAKDPAQRLAGAEQVINAIDEFTGPGKATVVAAPQQRGPAPASAASARKPARAPLRRKFVAGPVAMLLGALAVAGVVTVLLSNGTEPPAATPAAATVPVEQSVSRPPAGLILGTPGPQSSPTESVAKVEHEASLPVIVETVEPRASATVAKREPRAAAVPQGSPAPTAQTGADRYIALGDARVREYKLTSPPGDNAFDYYQHALALDPGNLRARAGYARIADAFARLATQRIDRGDLLQAQDYIDQGLAIDPDHPRLRALNRRVMLQKGSRRIVRGVEDFVKDIKDKINR